MGDVVTLFRPVGSAELALIVVAQWKAFPERLADHPYLPPSNEAEARAFAQDWCARHDDDRCGFVIRFTMRDGAIIGPMWLVAEYGCK